MFNFACYVWVALSLSKYGRA